MHHSRSSTTTYPPLGPFFLPAASHAAGTEQIQHTHSNRSSIHSIAWLVSLPPPAKEWGPGLVLRATFTTMMHA